MKFQIPSIHGSKDMSSLKSVTYRQTNGQTYEQAKSNMSSLPNFFEIGGWGHNKYFSMLTAENFTRVLCAKVLLFFFFQSK